MPKKTSRSQAVQLWPELYDTVVAVYDRNLTAATTAHGLTGGEVKALLKLEPGAGAPMRALAKTWHSDASTVTWMADRLERRGLVERRPLEGARVVALTTEGETVQDAVRSQLYAPPDGWKTLTGDDLACLAKILTKLGSTSPA